MNEEEWGGRRDRAEWEGSRSRESSVASERSERARSSTPRQSRQSQTEKGMCFEFSRTGSCSRTGCGFKHSANKSTRRVLLGSKHLQDKAFPQQREEDPQCESNSTDAQERTTLKSRSKKPLAVVSAKELTRRRHANLWESAPYARKSDTNRCVAIREPKNRSLNSRGKLDTKNQQSKQRQTGQFQTKQMLTTMGRSMAMKFSNMETKGSGD